MTIQERIDFINELIDRTWALRKDYDKLVKDINNDIPQSSAYGRYRLIRESLSKLGNDSNSWYLKDIQTFFKAEQYDILMTEESNK